MQALKRAISFIDHVSTSKGVKDLTASRKRRALRAKWLSKADFNFEMLPESNKINLPKGCSVRRGFAR